MSKKYFSLMDIFVPFKLLQFRIEREWRASVLVDIAKHFKVSVLFSANVVTGFMLRVRLVRGNVTAAVVRGRRASDLDAAESSRKACRRVERAPSIGFIERVPTAARAPPNYSIHASHAIDPWNRIAHLRRSR